MTLGPELDLAVCRAMHGRLEDRRVAAARVRRALVQASLEPFDLVPWLSMELARSVAHALVQADVLVLCRDDVAASDAVTASIFAWLDESTSIAERAERSADLDARAVLIRALEAGAVRRWRSLARERRATERRPAGSTVAVERRAGSGRRGEAHEEVLRAIARRRGGS